MKAGHLLQPAVVACLFLRDSTLDVTKNGTYMTRLAALTRLTPCELSRVASDKLEIFAAAGPKDWRL